MIIINPYIINSAPLTLTYVNSNIIASATLTLPTGWAAGDLAILMEYLGSDSAVTLGSPAGWTDIDSITSLPSYAGRFGYRVLEAGDTNIVTGSTSLEKATALFVFRPNRSIRTITASSKNKEATGGNPASQSVSASGLLAPVLVLGLAGANGGGGWNFATASPAFDTVLEVDPGNTYMRAAIKHYAASPGDHTIDMADQGAGNVLMSCALSFT